MYREYMQINLLKSKYIPTDIEEWRKEKLGSMGPYMMNN